MAWVLRNLRHLQTLATPSVGKPSPHRRESEPAEHRGPEPPLGIDWEPLENLRSKIMEFLKEQKRLSLYRVPELYRVWGEVYDDIDKIEVIHQRGTASGIHPAQVITLNHLKCIEPSKSTVAAAWAALDELDRMIIELADSSLLYMLLKTEVQSMKIPLAQRQSEGVTAWDQVFQPHLLDELLKKYCHEPYWSTEARTYLQILQRERCRNELIWRQRMGTRARYFWIVLLLLTPVVMGFGLASNLLVGSSTGWKGTVLAAVAGAVGSLMSGAARLRELRTITQLRLLRMGIFGLFISLVIQSGLVGFPGVTQSNERLAAGVYGFVGGFSEPFFLGVVRRLAAGGNEDSGRAGASGAQPP